MYRDGRWFWWLAAGCLCVLVADVTEIGPFAEAERRQPVEVLGDSVEREQVSTSSTSTTLSEDEALEQLHGLDQETLNALEAIKGVDPADLTTKTTP